MNDTAELEIKSINLTGEPKPSAFVPVREHEGHIITLTDDLRFEVSGPQYPPGPRSARDSTFDALVDAKRDITKRIQDELKERARTQSLSIPIITDLGEITHITKLNRTSGDIDAKCTRYFYPASQWVVDAVRRRQEIQKELQPIETKLERIRMSSSRCSGRIDVDSLGFYIDRLQKEYNEKQEEATKLTPQESKQSPRVEEGGA